MKKSVLIIKPFLKKYKRNNVTFEEVKKMMKDNYDPSYEETCKSDGFLQMIKLLKEGMPEEFFITMKTFPQYKEDPEIKEFIDNYEKNGIEYVMQRQNQNVLKFLKEALISLPIKYK